LNQEILPRIEQLKTEWDAVQPLPERIANLYWQRLRVAWDYNSNHIEGNTLSYSETYLLLIHGRTKGNHLFREYVEMQAHDTAVEHVRTLAADARSITEADVCDLNLITLKEPFWKPAITPWGDQTYKQIFPGQYKTAPNNVRTVDGGIYTFAPPEEVPAMMAELIQWFREESQRLTEPLPSVLAKFHHRFSVIHPFDDGNGRVMRLLVNYALLRLGYPPIVIRSVDRAEYIAALSQGDGGDLGDFTNFIARNMVTALERGVRMARGKSDEGDWRSGTSAMLEEEAAFYGSPVSTPAQ